LAPGQTQPPSSQVETLGQGLAASGLATLCDMSRYKQITFKILLEKKMAINKEWHEKNLMPKNATFEERVKWHLEHQEQCKCAPIPKKLKEEMNKKGYIS
jgi:hypothetical protein